ncbi:small multi-drug export protein [Candidatus Saccharibacteria bacterium]|nr:small multi-drug export protein [Candidatus Saccharibacteria bacterium]
MFIFDCLIVFIVSMVPLVELRGAIPIGVGLGLPEILTLVIAIFGNLLPVPLIFVFARRFLEWGANKSCQKTLKKFCNFCLKKGEKAGKKLQDSTGESLYFALFLFVGIPLPGTGAWTGTLAASLLDLDFKKSVIAVIAGVLCAGLIMLLISLGLFNIVFT